MKYILFIMLVYGTPDNNLVTVLKGPVYDDPQTCAEAAKTFVAKSSLPLAYFGTECEGIKQATK